MEAKLLQHMGSDLSVVNAARVSFHKESTEFSEKDEKLITYLAKHNHWTPYSHTALTFHVKAPIFVARQAFKHKVGFNENEVSRRYVDDKPEFFMPDAWRGRPINGAKQGSSDETINEIHTVVGHLVVDGHKIPHYDLMKVSEAVQALYDHAEQLYTDMIEGGIAPEQARMVLPQAMFTEWHWTSSLVGWARFYNLRTDPHAQREIQDLARNIGPQIEPLFPVSWKALTNESL